MTHHRERPALRPQRVEQLIGFTAHIYRFVRGRNRAREFCLAECGQRLAAVEEVDPAHIACRGVAAVDLLHEARHLAEPRPPFEQTPVEFCGIKAALDAYEQQCCHSTPLSIVPPVVAVQGDVGRPTALSQSEEEPCEQTCEIPFRCSENCLSLPDV